MTGRIKTLLSVDWDFFFPIDETGDDSALYDWGHNETTFFVNGPLWNERAARFLSLGKALPDTNDAEREFWKRFRFSRNARLYIADSHSRAVEVGNPETILSYDAHHDCGYDEATVIQHGKEGHVYCDDWLAFMISSYRCNATVIYPPWREWRILEPTTVVPVHRVTDSGQSPAARIDAVFVCRSGAWTPPWLDHEFQTFVDGCPIRVRQHLQDTTPRDFKMAEARAIARV